MRILICAFTYWPAVDGVQNVTEYQAEGLTARGYDVTVLTGYLPEKNLPEEEEHNGIHIRRFAAHTETMLHHGDKAAYQRLLKEYAAKVDVIMTVCPESWCTLSIKSVLSIRSQLQPCTGASPNTILSGCISSKSSKATNKKASCVRKHILSLSVLSCNTQFGLSKIFF